MTTFEYNEIVKYRIKNMNTIVDQQAITPWHKQWLEKAWPDSTFEVINPESS